MMMNLHYRLCLVTVQFIINTIFGFVVCMLGTVMCFRQFPTARNCSITYALYFVKYGQAAGVWVWVSVFYNMQE